RRPLLWSVEPDGKPGARLEVVPAPGESGTGPHRSGTGAEETGAGHRAPTPTALDPRTLGQREEPATVEHRGGRLQGTAGTADKRNGETSIGTVRGQAATSTRMKKGTRALAKPTEGSLRTLRRRSREQQGCWLRRQERQSAEVGRVPVREAQGCGVAVLLQTRVESYSSLRSRA